MKSPARHVSTSPAAVAGRAPVTTEWRWRFLAAALPVALCAWRLDDELWHDEIYTVVHFASRSPSEIARDYSAANNHVLYSLVLSTVCRLSLAEPVLRLPSLISSVASLALVYLLGRRVGGRLSAVLAVLVLGLCVTFLTHTMQIRGYGLSMALTAGLALAAVDAGGGGGWRRVAIIVAGAALVYTVPTNALVGASLAVAAVGLARVRGGWRTAFVEAGWWGAALVLAAACYAPIFEQVRAVASEAPRARPEAVARLAMRFLAAAFHDSWPLVAAAVVAAPAWWVRSGKTRQEGVVSQAQAAWTLLALACGLPFVACAVLRVAPFERNFTPLLPILAVVVAGPLAGAFEMAAQRFRPMGQGALALLAGAVVLAIMLPGVVLYPARLAEVCRREFAQGGYYNYYAAAYRPSEAVRALKRDLAGTRDGYVICFSDDDQANLVFYLNREDVPRQRAAPAGGRTMIYAIAHPRLDAARLAAGCGGSETQWEAARTVADSGYYRVLALEE